MQTFKPAKLKPNWQKNSRLTMAAMVLIITPEPNKINPPTTLIQNQLLALAAAV